MKTTLVLASLFAACHTGATSVLAPVMIDFGASNQKYDRQKSPAHAHGDGGWTEEETLPPWSEGTVAELSGEWTEGVNYLAKTVAVDSAHPDILVVGGFLRGNDNKGGVVNFVQVVPSSPPGTVLLLR